MGAQRRDGCESDPAQIAGIALLAGGVYEVIKHWSAIKAWVNVFFKEIQDDIFNFLMGPWNRLGDAITAKYKTIESAVEGVAHGIAKFFVGRSPIPYGPLHDLNLGKQIAWSLDPAPVIAAARRLAIVTAMTMPIAIGAGAVTAAARGPSGAASAATEISVTINQTVHVAGGDPAQLVAALRSHNSQLAKSLVDEVEREMARRRRSQY